VAGIVIGSIVGVCLCVTLVGVLFFGWTFGGLLEGSPGGDVYALQSPVKNSSRTSDVELNYGKAGSPSMSSVNSALSVTVNPMLEAREKARANSTAK
jgi:hypothetical protein